MRGFPKRFNTKQDVMNVLETHPEQTNQQLQVMLDNRHNWFIMKELSSTEAGVEDATHRVREDKDMDGVVIARYQEEWKEDSNATLFRLGFTVDEAKNYINNDSNN